MHGRRLKIVHKPSGVGLQRDSMLPRRPSRAHLLRATEHLRHRRDGGNVYPLRAEAEEEEKHAAGYEANVRPDGSAMREAAKGRDTRDASSRRLILLPS